MGRLTRRPSYIRRGSHPKRLTGTALGRKYRKLWAKQSQAKSKSAPN
jgi:hypothetical protein